LAVLGFWTQGSTLARQVLYHMSHDSSSPKENKVPWKIMILPWTGWQSNILTWNSLEGNISKKLVRCSSPVTTFPFHIKVAFSRYSLISA
jgi:hypothetical protein